MAATGPTARLAIASGLAAVAIAALTASAGAEMLNATYNISLAGLSIGRASIDADITGTRYKIDVGARMTGLAGVLTRGSGQATATGLVGQRAPNSNGYSLSASSSDGPRTIRMAMAGGAVRAFEMNPPLEERPDRVPVAPGHKRGVLDPVSALVMPIPQGPKGPLDPAGCNRTLPIYDGASRFDVILSYKEAREVRTASYAGPVLVCGVRYVPHAGHRPSRKAIQFMIENRDMETWLAPVGAARVLVPYRISVMTMIGNAVVEASNFNVHATTGSTPARARAAR